MVFLQDNGFEFPADDLTLYEAMIAIANKEMDKYDLAGLFGDMLK